MAEASSTDDVITLRIRFKSETLERFIERYGGDLGPEQVFVRTRQPLAIGTPIAFDFTLNDGSPLLSGRGTVGWARSEPDANGPAGMGVQFTSLPAASWQTLRRVLAARGADSAVAGAPPAALGVQSSVAPVAPMPVAPAPVSPFAPALSAAVATGHGGAPGVRRTTTPGTPAMVKQVPEDPEEAERTEVARMPPNFFDAAEGGPRTQDRGRGRPVTQAATPRGESAVTDRPAFLEARPRQTTRQDELKEELFENLSLDEVEDVTGQLTRPIPRRATPLLGTPAPNPVTPQVTPRPAPAEPAWRTHVPQAAQSGGQPLPVRGTAAMPAWTQPTPPRGLPHVTARDVGKDLPATPAPRGPAVYDDPVSSTAPTLPATAAVLLYDPDDPKAPLQPAARQPAVPFTAAPPPPASASVMAAPMAPGNAYQEGFYPPAEEAGGYPETNFDPSPYVGPGRATSPRSTVGRIGPAISPEEMALAATAVRGLEGEAPMYPGFAEEPRRGGTAKIWLALVLAAGGVIAGVLWLVPLISPGLMRGLFTTDAPVVEPLPVPASGESAPGPGVPAPGGTPEAPSGAAPATGAPAAAAPPAVPPAAAPPAAAPAPAEKAEPPAAEPPARRRPAAVADDEPAPAPRRRRRRDPAEVIADAESRAARAAEGAVAAPGAAPSPAAPASAGLPEAAPVEGPAAEDIYWLSVRSTPTGADVIIDGQVEGKTPFTRRIFNPSRTYALVVRKPGFTSLERTVTGGAEWTRRGNVRTLTVTAKLNPVGGAAPPPAAPPTPTGRTNPFDEPLSPPPVPRP